MKYGPQFGLLIGLLAAPCAGAKAADVHIYTNYDQSEPAGITLPSGPDETVNAVVRCPGSDARALRIVLAAGATASSSAISPMSSPLYQYMKLDLEQDYAVAPTRILWRFVMANVGISGFMGPEDEDVASFNGPDCPKPWKITLTSSRLQRAYSPETVQGVHPAQTPFPDEP
jgi:hypothetical protein